MIATLKQLWLSSMGAGLLALVLLFSGQLNLSAQEKLPAAATSTSLIELKPARLMFVDRHEVAFDRPGVLQLVLEEAETVKAGQVVARLEDGIAKAAVAVADARVLNNAEVVSAQKQAELALLKLDSAKAAIASSLTKFNEDVTKQTASGVSPTEELKFEPPFNKAYTEELRLSYEAAQSDIGRFEKEHGVNVKGRDQAQAELNALELKAPRDGLVTRAFKQAGEGVQSGEKVLEIISTKRIRVEVEVPAVTAARLKVGIPVTVIVQQPSGENTMDLERYPTLLRFIDPTIGQVSQKVRIWAEIDNSDGKLREGLTASIEIVPSAPAPTAKPQ